MDKLIQKLIQKAKKNKALTLPILLVVFVLIFFRHLRELFINIGKMNRTKKIIAGVMAAALVVALLGPLKGLFGIMNVNAEAVEWDGVSVDTAWYDAAPDADRFTISTAAGLAGLARLVNSGVAFYGKEVYVTYESISMNFHEFTPIGTTDNPFLGKFSAAGADGSLNVTKFYSSTPGMGIFANTHSDYINSVTGVSFLPAAFTGDVDGSGTDRAQGAFVGADGVLYLPLTDVNGNYNVQYKVVAVVTPDNAWCPDVSYRIINSNDGIECTEDGIISVHQAGTYEILAEARDPFTYGTDTKEAVIEVKVYERTSIEADGILIDHEYGIDTDFGHMSQYVSSNYPDRLSYSVLEDYNAAGIYISGDNHLHATGVGTSVLMVNGYFANEQKMVNVTVLPTVKGIALSTVPDVLKPGESVECLLKVDSGALPAGVSVNTTPQLRIVAVDGTIDDFWLDGNILTARYGAYSTSVTLNAVYTNPYSNTTITSKDVYIAVVPDAVVPSMAAIVPSVAATEGVSEGMSEGASEGATEGESFAGGSVAPTENPSENETESASENVTENSTEKMSEGTLQKPTADSGERATEKSTEQETLQDPTETSTEKTTETSTEKSSEPVSEGQTEQETTESATEDSTKDLTEGSTENATKDKSEVSTENMTEDVTEESTEKSTEEVTKESGEASSEDVTKPSTEDVTEDDMEELTEEATEVQTDADTESASVVKDEEQEAQSVDEQSSQDDGQVQSDIGTSQPSGGYDGTVAPIYYDRYYKVSGNVEEGYAVVISGKYDDAGASLEFAPDDYFDASTYDSYGNGTFTYYVRCNAEDDYAFTVRLDSTLYNWNKTAYIIVGGLLTELSVMETEAGLAYEVVVPMDVLSGDRNVMITDVSCADATITKAYVNNMQYDLEPVDGNENAYKVTMPFGTLPTSTSQIRFNSHETSQVVMSELYTEEEGVYVSVTIIPVDVATASKAYTIHFVEEMNTHADIDKIKIGDVEIDFTVDNETSSVEEIATGNLYKAVYNGALTTDISASVSPYASYTIDSIETDSTAGKIVLKITVTAQDGLTVKRHTVMLKNNGTLGEIVVVPGDITYTQEDVDAIASQLMGKTYAISERDVPDGKLDDVRKKADILVRQSLGSLLTEGLEIMITDISYTPAASGQVGNADGLNGNYTFSVTVKSASYSSVAVGMAMTINAIPYVIPEIDYVRAENGKVEVVLMDAPSETPDLTWFSGSIRINGGILGYYTLYNSKATYDPKTYTITYYPEVLAKAEYEQSIAVYVSYNGGLAVAAPIYIIGAMGQCATPVASVASGEFQKVFTVELATATPGATIHYTLDGTTPNEDSPIYTGPITIPGGMFGDTLTTTLRAYSSMEDMIPSAELVNTYSVTIPHGTQIGSVEVLSGNVPSISVAGMDKLFQDISVYTGADRTVVASGGSVKLWLRISERQMDELISNGGQTALDANRLSTYCKENNYQLYSIYDISLVKQVTDKNGETTVTTVEQMLNQIQIGFALNEEQQTNSQIKVLGAYLSQVEPYSDIDTSSVTYTIATNKLSLFALGYNSKTFHPIFTGGGNSSAGDDSSDMSDASGTLNNVLVGNQNNAQTGVQNGAEASIQNPTSAVQPGPVTSVVQGSNQSVNQSGAQGNGQSGGQVGSQNGAYVPGQNGTQSNLTGSDSANSSASAGGSQQLIGENAKTGDNAPIMILAIILIVSAIVMVMLFITGRKKK